MIFVGLMVLTKNFSQTRKKAFKHLEVVMGHPYHLVSAVKIAQKELILILSGEQINEKTSNTNYRQPITI